MRRDLRIAWTGAGVAAAVAALAYAATGGLQLFDAPRGAWLAEVRADASLVVVEEREGWKRIRIEGWIPAGAVGGVAARAPEEAAPARASAPGAEAAPAPEPGVAPAPTPPDLPPPTVATDARGAGIEGILMPARGTVPATVGANLVVLLIADVKAYGAGRRALESDCRSRIASLDQAVQEAQTRYTNAFNSTTNFTEASHRNDRAKKELAAAKQERAGAARACLAQADELAERFSVSRTASDSSGRFRFEGLAAGAYHIVAFDHREGVDRAWAFDATTTPGATVALDPATAAAADPYAGLR